MVGRIIIIVEAEFDDDQPLASAYSLQISSFMQVPFSKMLTFFRREPFTLQAQYTSPSTFPDPIIGHYTIENVSPGPEGECQKVSQV